MKPKAKVQSVLYQEHIEQLAAELGVKLVQGLNLGGMMFVEETPMRIEGPTMVNDLSASDSLIIGHPYPNLESRYMTMLHELGHCAWGHTQGRPPATDKTFYFDNGVLKSEAQAWEWALDHRLNPDKALAKETIKFMWDYCLNSYLGHAVALKGQPTRLHNGNRAYVEFVFDEPDEFFWGIKERILRGY